MAKPPAKPLVFLSHSSKNRWELRALKAFLDQRAAGQIEFFLSSDDESIQPGSIWPTEVKKALDRMKLMVVFLSKDALESSWTYFEAGYGLCKLGVASVYCLEGTKRDAVPPPFDVLQNRNLHSAKDLTLLLKQCNQALGTQFDEAVTKAEFDKIFRTWPSITVKTSPPFHEIVESIVILCQGKPDVRSNFENVCKALGHTFHGNQEYTDTRPYSRQGRSDDIINTVGLKLRVTAPDCIEEIPVFNISNSTLNAAGKVTGCPLFYGRLKEGLSLREVIEIYVWSPMEQIQRRLYDPFDDHEAEEDLTELPLPTVQKINTMLERMNLEISHENSRLMNGPRSCRFEISSERASIPIEIFDLWAESGLHSSGIKVQLVLKSDVRRERRTEIVSARLYGTELRQVSSDELIWRGRVPVIFSWGDVPLTIECKAEKSLSELDAEELIATLWRSEIIHRIKPTKPRRR